MNPQNSQNNPQKPMIYLDHAAATPVNKKALAAMHPYWQEQFFNPSAPYLPAKAVREAYEAAKGEIAHQVGAKAPDLIMTSGATESNALAAATVSASGKTLLLATEHPSMRSAASQAANIAVLPSGIVDLADLRAQLTPDVELISISLVNNETGAIQPLTEVAEIVRAERLRRLEQGEKRPLYLHSDASQALNLLQINIARLGVDLLTLNSAKVGGPKGVGALYVGHGVRLQPLIPGGGQERGLRGGTENVAGTIGFAAALSDAQAHLQSNRKKYQKLAQILRSELADAAVEPVFIGASKKQLASFVPVSFPGLDAERLIFKLEATGVYVATGAACAASKGEKSHVLAAMGLPKEVIAGSLRISLGPTNDEAQMHQAAALIKQAVAEEAERINR